MRNFKLQIEEDIKDYQARHKEITNIQKPEWAFNFWVLDKLYSVDEDLIVEKILDYKDLGTDCYVWHEDSKDLYLIQNKYYSESTVLDSKYVKQNFLKTTLANLEANTYSRSEELQHIFNEHKEDEEFTVHLNLYVTNNKTSEEVNRAIKEFNSRHVKKYVAKIFWLDDIERAYFGQPTKDKKKMNFEIQSVNNATIMSIDPKKYNLNQPLSAHYVFTPILNIYELVAKAEASGYPLFEENIREYLGTKVTVNKGIRNTLLDETDCRNFFYYNNGITMIVSNCPTIFNRENENYVSIMVENPQIVNGCQTVSTIYETLKNLDPNELKKKFESSFVMVKILTIPDTDTKLKELSHNIVKFNNSQNSIGKSTFESISPRYNRIKKDFSEKGFLVCVKQSDKNTYEKNYKKSVHILKENNSKLLTQFGIEITDNYKDYVVDLETLLQIFVAFTDSQSAIQKKSHLLVPDSNPHKIAMDFIDKTTSMDRIWIYLFYVKLKQLIISTKTKAVVNPFMLINCFGRCICKNRPESIQNELSSLEKTTTIIEHFIMVLKMYYDDWFSTQSKGYNDMIKHSLDFDKIDKYRGTVSIIKPINY